MRTLALALLCAAALPAQTDLSDALSRNLLDPNEPLLDAQVYTAWRVPPMPSFRTRAEWEAYAADLRRRLLDDIVFRGEAAQWRAAKTRTEIREPFASGQGYRVRHFLYEIIPGFLVPGLIYEPVPLSGRVPVVLNVNGHEGVGTANSYIQARCINLAKKGMIAINPEWLGRGQLDTPGMSHARMPQLDLTGTAGLSLFYLALSRAVDFALSLPNADPTRLAVTGLSGGGWQTITISSLDTRVALSRPVAGYSSFLTRAQWPDLDLGDAEQTPSDLATLADYTHLTALLAPRPVQLAYNAKDNCCFRADYAFSPLLQAAAPIYRLFNASDNLSFYVNHGPGHNYDQDNREALYRFLKEHFRLAYDPAEIDVTQDLRSPGQLRPPLPAGNLDFHQLALKLAASLPVRNVAAPSAARLGEIVRYRPLNLEATPVSTPGPIVHPASTQARYWKLRIDRSWTVPATDLAPAQAKAVTILLGDQGRAALARQARALLAAGHRVIAFDPFYLGESRIARRNWLFAMQIAALGERPLGLQAAQIAAVARWAAAQGAPVEVAAAGPRTSLMALIAAALEPKAIQAVTVEDSLASLKDILTRDITVDTAPELFCFGLLREFDLPQIAALVRPRPVRGLP